MNLANSFHVIQRSNLQEITSLFNNLLPSHRSYICFYYITYRAITVTSNIIDILVTYERRVLNYKLAADLLCENNGEAFEAFENHGFKINERFMIEMEKRITSYISDYQYLNLRGKENLETKLSRMDLFFRKRGIEIFNEKLKL